MRWKRKNRLDGILMTIGLSPAVGSLSTVSGDNIYIYIYTISSTAFLALHYRLTFVARERATGALKEIERRTRLPSHGRSQRHRRSTEERRQLHRLDATLVYRESCLGSSFQIIGRPWISPLQLASDLPTLPPFGFRSFKPLHRRRRHASAVVMADQEFFPLAEEALNILAEKGDGHYKPPLLIVIGDENCDPEALKYALSKGAIEYEKFLETGNPEYAWKPPEDEWQSITLGYTSGTTASPKGVVLSHRGAYVMSLSAGLVWGMNEGAIYLWTLPMFHCNGWCYTWALAALCGTSICLRQVTAKAVYSAIAKHKVTHFCAAPVVLNTIVNAPKEDTILPLPHVVHVMTAGAAPPPSVLYAMSQKGFRITHTYGLSETYGPSTICAWKPEWDSLPPEVQARMNARQGVRYVGLEGLDVVNTQTMQPVPSDGKTVGEIVMRGNAVMKGYLKNPKANKEAFANGWFHSGDLGVKHPDGYIEIKDRSKDIIISGGENISSVEIENTLYQHPAILEVSVVARADERWGESPCAFVTLKSKIDKGEEQRMAEDIMKFCKSKMPAYWVPKSVVFGELPKTATGKVQKHLLRAKAKEMGPVKISKL